MRPFSTLKEKSSHINSGRKGAYAHNALYGNPGTPEGRREGGLNSLKSDKLQNTGFKFRKKINLPEQTERLAEIIGIFIGDGNLSQFQARVTLGFNTDEKYAHFVQSLLEELFDIKPSLLFSKDQSTIDIAISSRNLVEFLIKCELPIGNKVKQEIDIPSWIKTSKPLTRACLRGIFDTDGCIYIDSHSRSNTRYMSINVAWTNASQKLLDSIYKNLSEDGYNPNSYILSFNPFTKKKRSDKIF